MEEAALRRARILEPAKKILLVLLVGILYYVFVRLTGLRIPCVYFLVSGNYCPGCGITRMFLALGQFDFALAVRNNALVLFLAPFALAFAGGTMLYVISDEMIPETHAHEDAAGVTYALLAGFCVMLVSDVLLG